MRKYQDMVFSTSARLVRNDAQAEDIAQEVFIKAYEHFEMLSTSPSAGGWLKTVATNLSINHLQRYRKRWKFFSEFGGGSGSEGDAQPAVEFAAPDTFFEAIDSDERRAIVEEALAKLPDHQRIPLVLYHFEDVPYAEFLTRLLRAQWHARQESALEWRIRRANLPERWSLETFPFARQPGVNRKQIRTLAELEFIAKAENIVFIGETARGKTGLACGLLLKALENGYRGQFVRAQDLFDEMYASLADRSTRQLLKRLARLDVLVVDELGYLNLKPEQSNIFFKLMEERYHQHSTIITTNLIYDEWPNFLGSRPMVEALLSRLRHYCHTLHIKGPSLREPQG